MTSSNVQQLEPLTLKTALRYAAMGWPVLPLVPNKKVPATAHGVHDATTDPAQIKRWWGENPTYNVGIAAGKESGLVVFDIDPRNGGEAGWEAWLALAGHPDEGAMQLTAGGGQHYLGLYDPAITSCKLEQGVDLLSEGKYFVAYPSTIDGKRYEWEGSLDPLDGVAPFPVPQRWRELYLNRARKKVTTAAELIKGNRNDGLTALAGAMRHHGMGEREILAALEVSNETRCDPPLPSSEVARIARSIARYAPESDVAAEVAMGSAAAEALLANHAPPPANDWITHADDFSAQPAAINWWVKMWVQKQALMMVHGPSGGGKTFVTLDWLLHIASGRPEWAGLKVKKGTVLYLAGEGHADLRARIAAWKHHHQVQHLDFYVSRDAVDLNTPEGLRRVIEAIEALGFIPDIIAIDTVHRHMVGDENSAADTKTFIDAADTLKKRFNATVLLVHHTGNSDEAQHRARGSSAWRGALDIEISVVPGKKDAPIRIVQRKSKDAELAPHVCVQLQGVYIPGWFDDEGEQISSAVPVITECDSDEAKDEHDKALVGHIRMIQEAWRSTGEELFEGSPYITKSALLSFLINNKGLSESSAKQYVKPSQGKRLIGNLINNDIAKEALNGFAIVEPSMVSQLMLGKK
jgi:hypothetical protein